jgi:cob(I)alamin adenosyltransferase
MVTMPSKQTKNLLEKPLIRPRQQLGVEAALKVTTEIGRFSIYSGAGKGKSAAALGVVLRSFGLGVASNLKHRVALVRFLKGADRAYDEDAAIDAIRQRYPHLLDTVRFGRSEYFGAEDILESDRAEAIRGWQVATGMLLSGLYKVVVLDELNPVIDLGLLDVGDVLSILKQRPNHVEVIITGRSPHPDLVAIARVFALEYCQQAEIEEDLHTLYGITHIVASENLPNSDCVYNYRPPAQTAWGLVVGNEAKGLRRRTLKQADAIVEVPVLSKTINCLNVAAAAAVMLYYLNQPRPLKYETKTLKAIQKRRPDLLLVSGKNPMELGSTLRSACAFGWQRVFLQDRGHCWYECPLGQ